jgi:tRNA (guanine37-N1)-methyltransferase
MTSPWKATVLTLFPEMFPGPLGASLAGRALADGIWALEAVDIRGFARDKHRTVDDAPFGGGPGVTLLCGRFEGIDQRVLDAHGLDEVSLGDFVLSGGEPAAIALIDAVVRLLPGVVGATETLVEESFEHGLLEYPHYTRPQVWRDPAGRDRAVPEVLLSGDHARIKAWRRAEAEAVTRRRRPDLWERHAGRHRPAT